MRARVAAVNPRGEPAKQGREVFAGTGPAPSSTVSRTLHSPHPIFLSRAAWLGTFARSADGPFSITTSNPRLFLIVTSRRSFQYLSQVK
ncbi:hypothetical protein JG687_00014097 [Phytophthora cactorum]|uniref:Uncharacterized protein n=1 Tax=Phytophthora cactorum TaxID=29920 RepID=A0A8T1U062_9STRA|nr:hypothetical protein JG687_00014097 [Phytophthora cactorum]